MCEPRCLASGSTWISEPPGGDAQERAQVIEVAVEVEDVESGGLRGDDDAQVGEGKAMGAVGAGIGEVAHDCQDALLNRPVDPDLAEGFEGAVERRNR